MPYLKLFHGRQRPEDRLEDDSRPGPIFGPSPFFLAVGGTEIRFNFGACVLHMVGDQVYYDGLFYADWSVFDGPPSDDDRHRLTDFDADKANVPEAYRRCECEQPGYFHCGVPGILAHLENGRLPPAARVERCDLCERYADDNAARKKLAELGILGQSDVPHRRYTVHVYATVRVTFGELEAPSHEAAARMAETLFDWDQDKSRAEYADEITEYLVDVAGDVDYSRSRRLNTEFEEIAV